MTGIARFVQDKDLKRSFVRPMGRSSRAGIVELLFKRGFLTKKGAISTLRRRKSVIPFAARNGTTRPDMTAHWESVLTQIGESSVAIRTLCSRWWGRYINIDDPAKRAPVRQFRGIVAPGSGTAVLIRKRAAPRKRSAKSPPADEVGSGAIA